MSESSPTPWWASILTSVITTMLGLATIVVAIVWVHPVDPTTALWLIGGGAAATGVGGSVLTKRARAGNERGSSPLGLLAAIVVLALVPPLLSTAAGCGSREVVAERSIGIEVRRGPPCDIRLRADDEQVCRVYSETERCDVQIAPENAP